MWLLLPSALNYYKKAWSTPSDPPNLVDLLPHNFLKIAG